jgi:hypothetical protein
MAARSAILILLRLNICAGDNSSGLSAFPLQLIQTQYRIGPSSINWANAKATKRSQLPSLGNGAMRYLPTPRQKAQASKILGFLNQR